MLQYPSTLCFRGACFARVCEHFVSADGTGPNVCMTEKKKRCRIYQTYFILRFLSQASRPCTLRHAATVYCFRNFKQSVMCLHSEDTNVRPYKLERKKGWLLPYFMMMPPILHLCCTTAGTIFFFFSFGKIINCCRPVAVIYLTDGCVLENLQ